MVVDTSVLMEALLPGERFESARRVLAEADDLVAPDLIEVEAGVAVTKGVRRGALPSSAAGELFESARRFMEVLAPTQPLLPRALDLSIELAHPFADCVFLALAESRSTRLVSLDRRFMTKVRASRYAHLVLDPDDWRS